MTHTSIEDGRNTILPRFEAFLSKILAAKYEAETKAEDDDIG